VIVGAVLLIAAALLAVVSLPRTSITEDSVHDQPAASRCVAFLRADHARDAAVDPGDRPPA